MEQVHKVRAPKQGAARENAVLKAEPPHRRNKAVWEQARAGEQEEVPVAAKARAPVVVAAKVAAKAAVIGSYKSTIQQINDN
jgi:hypothetical protein